MGTRVGANEEQRRKQMERGGTKGAGDEVEGAGRGQLVQGLKDTERSWLVFFGFGCAMQLVGSYL